MAAKKAITLEEHLAGIRSLGGKVSMANRTAEEREKFARAGGQAGGVARKLALSPARRRAIAKKAAQARWGKKPARVS